MQFLRIIMNIANVIAITPNARMLPKNKNKKKKLVIFKENFVKLNYSSIFHEFLKKNS